MVTAAMSSIDYAKAFDCVDHNKLWKVLKEMGIPDHLSCLLRNLYSGQEATVMLLFSIVILNILTNVVRMIRKAYDNSKGRYKTLFLNGMSIKTKENKLIELIK